MRGSIKRIGCSALWLLITLGVLHASPGRAQAPDMREIYPYLMLVIDTSGSMERLPACACRTAGCEECLPNCDLANDASGQPPKDAAGKEMKKNRWAVTLEALTGSFDNFQCTKLERTDSSKFTYDFAYYLPYYQPWDCSPSGNCPFDDINNTRRQQNNGILDEYNGRVNFGLMTFDGWDTWVGAPPLVRESPDFNPNGLTLSDGESGLWSYGDPKSFHYPNCTTNYMMDTGARSASAEAGYLVSIGSCKTGVSCESWCDACWGTDPSEITANLNKDIQDALLSARPYGGTPIAASLDDLYYHFQRPSDDDFSGCRRRFALLMTDGYPDDDYRTFGCDCKNEGNPTDPDYADRCGINQDPNLMHCPYPLPEQAAFDLVHGKGTDGPMIEQLFVVGLAVEDTAVLNRLDAIADSGCPFAEGCEVDGHSALFADDLPTLVSTMSDIIQGFLHPISRSVPVFAGANASGVEQYQVSTGFEVPVESNAPWTGVIERRRFGCDAAGELDEATLSGNDLIHNIINAQDPRTLNIKTVVAKNPPNTGESPDYVYGDTSSTPCGPFSGTDPTGCTMLELNGGTVNETNLGLASGDTSGRDAIFDWMYGMNGSPRDGRKLGDIYHSSPVILSVPTIDTADEAFNVFRQREIVKDRPLTMFVGTNDGMLRAISLEEFRPTASLEYTQSYIAGQQMWAFVPPMFLPRLRDNLTGHRITMDGTPVVKNVYLSRSATAKSDTSADQYRTVLISGMRGGGNGYVALDVTNPTKPKFLWQFSDADMGSSYAQPAIAQASWREGTAIKNGAIAILSGGLGELGNSGVAGDCTLAGPNNPQMKLSTSTPFASYSNIATAPTTRDMRFRDQIRCWKVQGRALYFIDVATGRLIKKIFKDVSKTKFLLPSPMVSTPVIYQNDIGTRASRAFVVDADGVIWRIDLSTPDVEPDDGMKGWTARPFHDIFWDRGPADGERSYEAPILSTDKLGNVVVIVGTGDTDNFMKPTIQNKVVSLTEVFDGKIVSTEIADKWAAAVNWEKVVKTTNGLRPSELVTGAMGLYAGQLFFGTFISKSTTNSCDFGAGRVHAVNYIAHDTTDPNPPVGTVQTYGPLPLPNIAVGASDSVINVDYTEAEPNLMIMGLGITQRPSCDLADVTLDDPWKEDKIHTTSKPYDPALFLVAQGSGSTTSTSLLRANDGGRLLNVQLEVKRPEIPVRIMSWAGSVD
jgi:type IV pilus assembly protein PilY1